jgi:hypothetical protein
LYSTSIDNYNSQHPNGQTREDADAQLMTDIQTKEGEMSAALGPDVELT